MDSLLKQSATSLAHRIKQRQITSREVVEAHIARIQACNPTLNAVVATRFNEARREADAADSLSARNDPDALPPLHGVPCTIKECFALAGMPQTGGLVARRGQLASTDATAVARLRAAGAIPLGVTNVSELCMWMETDNRLYGRTNNPYDLGRIVGGSSGGEGSIVGAGGSPFGLGADVGGSIRMPAFFNGVFGHKPTGGLVPGTGQFPIAENGALRFLTTGPLARCAEDLMPLLRVMAGPDGKDAYSYAMTLGDPASVSLAGLAVQNVADNGAVPVSDELRSAQERVASFLASEGGGVRRASLPPLRRSLEIWSSMMSAEAETPFSALLAAGGAWNPSFEVAKMFAGRLAHTIPALVLALVENVPKWMPAREHRMVELGQRLRVELTELIGDGVLLFPSYSCVAPPHGKPLLLPFNWVYTAIWNVMEFPVTQVPLGLSREGLPLGVQVVAKPGNDHLTIGVALHLEKQFGGWVPPPRIR